MYKCIFCHENLVAKGLEITLEPTIGNLDFADNWYTNLMQFSIVFMKQKVAYCDKTEQKTQKTLMKPKQS